MPKGERRMLLPLASHSPSLPPREWIESAFASAREIELTEKKKRGESRLPLAQRQRGGARRRESMESG